MSQAIILFTNKNFQEYQSESEINWKICSKNKYLRQKENFLGNLFVFSNCGFLWKVKLTMDCVKGIFIFVELRKTGDIILQKI